MWILLILSLVAIGDWLESLFIARSEWPPYVPRRDFELPPRRSGPTERDRWKANWKGRIPPGSPSEAEAHRWFEVRAQRMKAPEWREWYRRHPDSD